MSVRSFLARRIHAPIHQQLTQGLSAERLALTVAVGLCIAINPIVGTTTILCFAAAWALRLNQPVIQAINWSSYALQLLLIFPFIRLGEWMFRAPRETRTLDRLVALMRADPSAAFGQLRLTLGHAFLAWLAAAPLIVASLFFATLPAFRALARRVASGRPGSGPEVA